MSYCWKLAYPESSGWWILLYLYSQNRSTTDWPWSCTDLLDLFVPCLLWIIIIIIKITAAALDCHDIQRSLSPGQHNSTFQIRRDILWCRWDCLCVCWAESLAKLFSLMDRNSPERVAFVSRALKWSTGGSGKLGHPKLHQLLAVTLWKGIQLIM